MLIPRLKYAGDNTTTMEEIWKDIRGCKGLYQVSDRGRVKSMGFITKRGIKRRGQILKPILKNNGYYFFNLCLNGSRVMKDLHRIIAENYMPNPHNKAEVNHINGIKTDNRPSNLEWATRKENAKHAYQTNLMPGIKAYYGEENSRSKLNSNQVAKIKTLLSQGCMQSEIAKQFGVNPSTIKAIKFRRTWKQVHIIM